MSALKVSPNKLGELASPKEPKREVKGSNDVVEQYFIRFSGCESASQQKKVSFVLEFGVQSWCSIPNAASGFKSSSIGNFSWSRRHSIKSNSRFAVSYRTAKRFNFFVGEILHGWKRVPLFQLPIFDSEQKRRKQFISASHFISVGTWREMNL